MDLVRDVWHWEIRLFPVLLSVLLFELPAIIQRRKRLYYVPLYFAVFPLRQLNHDLSVYLGEDFVGRGTELDRRATSKLRRQLVVTAVISTAVAAVLVPVVVGFCTAFYLDTETFYQFIAIFLAYKALVLCRSVNRFHWHAIATPANRGLLVVVYLCYLGVIFEMLRTTYTWTQPFVLRDDWTGLASSIVSLVFGRGVAGALILAAVTALFVAWVTDPKFRDRND